MKAGSSATTAQRAESSLTNFVGSLSWSKLAELDEALRIALGLSKVFP
jgi:hypothetical protein